MGYIRHIERELYAAIYKHTKVGDGIDIIVNLLEVMAILSLIESEIILEDRKTSC